MNTRNFRLLKQTFNNVADVLDELHGTGFPVLPVVLENRILTALLRDLNLEDEEDEYL